VENLKIRVNSESESREVQELFFELGASLSNGDKHAVLVPSIVGLAIIDDLINFIFNDVVFADIKQCEEITLPELRDLVVLKRNDATDCTHWHVTGQANLPYLFAMDEWYFFGRNGWEKSTHTHEFYNRLKPIEKPMKEYLDPKRNYELCLSDEDLTKEGMIKIPEKWMNFVYKLPDGDIRFSDNLVSTIADHIIWQRATHPEELPFIDDDPSLNDQYAEIEKVRQDIINSPGHYADSTIECIDAMEAMMTPEQFIGYLRGNVFKYQWRYEKKNGIEDLKKAQWYLDKLVSKVNEKHSFF